MGLNDAQTGLQVPLESVISTQELSLRPSRSPNSEALNSALITLAQTLARSPQHILKELVEAAPALAGRSPVHGLSAADDSLAVHGDGCDQRPGGVKRKLRAARASSFVLPANEN